MGVGLSQDQEVSSIKDIISDLDMVHISCGDPCDDEVPFNPVMLNKVPQTCISMIVADRSRCADTKRVTNSYSIRHTLNNNYLAVQHMFSH